MRALRTDGKTASLAASHPEPGASERAVVAVTRALILPADVAAASSGFVGTLGHSFAGVVKSVPEAGKKWASKRVGVWPVTSCGACELCKKGLGSHCASRTIAGLKGDDGGLADLVAVSLTNLYELPKTVDDERAAFIPLVAQAVHAAQMMKIVGKTYVTVLGDSALALVTAQVTARMNASVRLLGSVASKFGLCERWGVKHRHLSEVGRRHDQDVVICADAAPATLALATQLMRPRGTIIALSPTSPLPAPESQAMASALNLAAVIDLELEVLGARGGRPAEAVAMLAAGQVDVLPLITRRFKLADAAAALAAAATADAIAVMVEP